MRRLTTIVQQIHGFSQIPPIQGFASKVQNHLLDKVSTGSGSDLVKRWETKISEISMLINDQVATAPCTDCVEAQITIFRAKPRFSDKQGTLDLCNRCKSVDVLISVL